ncbi:hypothetical protein HMPREF9136_1274 [Prevotella dentalis DSM 3688]|uniref:Uncharacterized protein n=1 Tax=Prevotella dentalis (strain ATCC 49559 / DSM 3688 / JCM 13448 / NCTC 12043 / ES 2772) TaxID=908937 RepID=F9D346_PREDD|nr:hypothetical protein HMPREF9136_1274 [Prevotella dentalis DSM 3688]
MTKITVFGQRHKRFEKLLLAHSSRSYMSFLLFCLKPHCADIYSICSSV